jgi:hypothetical protein
MTAFFTCMVKFTDIEEKCMAEKRALTNCATAAVSVRNRGGGARWPAPREAAQHATASGASLLSLAEQLL